MAYLPQQQLTGSYTPTTHQLDPSEVFQTEVNSDEFKQLIVNLYQFGNLLSTILNTKDSAYYMTQEFITGQQFFNPISNNPNDNRMSFRKVINFGALGVATKSVAHGITVSATTIFTRIYGVASKTTVTRSYLPLPYASSTAVNNNIELSVDATNVTISNGIDRSAYDQCYVVLEYLQN